MRAWIGYLWVCFFGLLATSSASADELSTHAVGSGTSAMPAIGRVGVPDSERAGVTLAVGAGYGFTEGVLGDGDSHHRASGSVAIAVRPVDWLAIGLRFDGRFDGHLGDSGNDDGLVGDPRLLMRGSFGVGGGLRLGLEAGIWVPGGDAPSLAFDATTVDAVGLLAWSPSGVPLSLALRAGFRIDQSANAVDDPSQLSAADRLSLGLSSSHAALVGLGVSYRLGRAEILGEWTWDVLVGASAPGAMESPMRLAAGARYALSADRAWLVQGMLEAGLSSRPEIGPNTVLPVEPRVSASLALVWRIGGDGDSAAPVTEPEVVRQREPETSVPAEATTAVASSAETTSVRGRVVEDGAAPIEGASITLTAGGTTQTATSDANGLFAFESAALGPAHLSVVADGYESVELDSVLEAGSNSEASIPLVRSQPAGVIRGRVLSFDGRPIAATLEVQAVGDPTPVARAQAGADGAFEVEVAPGRYQVVLSAPGHEPQRRRIQVELGSVVDLSVNLRSSR